MHQPRAQSQVPNAGYSEIRLRNRQTRRGLKAAAPASPLPLEDLPGVDAAAGKGTPNPHILPSPHITEPRISAAKVQAAVDSMGADEFCYRSRAAHPPLNRHP